jgi:hypothetical protein
MTTLLPQLARAAILSGGLAQELQGEVVLLSIANGSGTSVWTSPGIRCGRHSRRRN